LTEKLISLLCSLQFFFFFFGDIGVWTQVFVLARQEL
jgi:hypothetical protein